MFKIVWDDKALSELNKLEYHISIRILKKVRELSNNSALDIKRLKGVEGFRLRVGDYRVLFDMDKDVINILKVGHRKNVYK
ncbi:MAG: type II toxin-antitoxin system RelE/ParE family toxin [Nanoarchaeota archaeon]